MSKTVTCLYQDQQKAAAIVSRLEQAGLSRGDIDVYTDASDTLIDDLVDEGVPRSDAHAYAEGVRRGRALVTVECDDDAVDRVVGILDGEGVLDLDEQQTSWRADGWQGHDASASGGVAGMGSASSDVASDLAGSGRTTRARADAADVGGSDQVIPIAEEELHVGKREVGHGRVRIQSRVVERPVQEQVTLREERVDVERRPASGTTQAGTISGDPFQERTIEVEERREEPVVSKEARVTEEVVVRKDVEERTETVSDTVRKTEVDIEDERRSQGTGTTGPTDRKR
ncbi:YsnF/AvaK domain-containing protein [Microvirga sp. TS319]|uniref:YsnF/AvaK domain-containing protein n=1 Tax=Microvirga sp. TS319 TaxID=3241165 RepID=UPI00351A764F